MSGGGIDEPDRVVELLLDQPSTLPDPDDRVRDGLSAAVYRDGVLWVVNDETISVERLQRSTDQRFADHRSFDLSTVFTLPGDAGEIDLEGLDVDGADLWMVGSHSAVRPKVKKDATAPDAVAALTSIEVSERRQVLARIPRVHLDAGPGDPATNVAPAVLGQGDASGGLLHVLSADGHLGPFLPSTAEPGRAPVPGKDNGVDFEGLAVRGSRVFIGLRGPVLRGWAMVVELDVGAGPLFDLQPIGTAGALYRKHFVDLHGLGVRDLCLVGSDLLILAGPTMELDGRTAVFRWPAALDAIVGDSVIRKQDLEHVLEIPTGTGTDRAEGITVLDAADNRLSVLVVYENARPWRKIGDHGVLADVFEVELGR